MGKLVPDASSASRKLLTSLRSEARELGRASCGKFSPETFTRILVDDEPIVCMAYSSRGATAHLVESSNL